jgi:hypothetical protein
MARAAAAALAALAACGCEGADTAGNGAGAKADPTVEVRPGLWQVESAILAASEPGLPHEIAERMKGPRRTVHRCFTAEEAARPGAALFAARGTGRCTDEAFEMRAGRIAGAAICRDASGVRTRLRLSGQYRADAYRVRIDVETPGIAPGRTMTLATRQSGRRVGDCP